MPHIQQLDPHVADLIAAGEVVERLPGPPGAARGPRDFTQIGRRESARFQGFSPRGKNACMRSAPRKETSHATHSAA